MQIEKSLEQIARLALVKASGFDTPSLLRPSADSRHGDYQLNAALGLAKQLGKNPRDLAEPWASALREHSAFLKVEVAGPGFVNLTLKPEWLAGLLSEDCADFERDGVPLSQSPRRVIVDFSSPNIAKQMHVGHLRSTIIGASLIRLLRAVGHDVTGVNHIGDWGTQYGLLLRGMKEFGDLAALANSPIAELERIYKLASAKSTEDPEFAERARAELVLLQQGNEDSLALWKTFVDTTRTELDRAYARLDVTFDSWRGESAYNDALSGVVQLLINQGLARPDQGAIGIFWPELEGAPERLKRQNEPFLVKKRDGAFLYSTTDIAAMLYRDRELHADDIFYVVDARQAGHFEQLFAVGKLLGVRARMHHVSFGTVLDESGKPLKTRNGVAITLLSLLDEAEARARAHIEEGIAEGRLKVSPDQVAEVAHRIGIGAVKYADLKQNRRSDYQFDWDKMVSFQGNAGPYLQYAFARVSSIFERGGERLHEAIGPVTLEEPEALELGRTLAKFGEAVEAAAETQQPHVLVEHLYGLAKAFMPFYEACPILKAEGPARRSRLALAGLTARQMKRGLLLLGIESPERM